mgnify:CR=1 FL=1
MAARDVDREVDDRLAVRVANDRSPADGLERLPDPGGRAVLVARPVAETRDPHHLEHVALAVLVVLDRAKRLLGVRRQDTAVAGHVALDPRERDRIGGLAGRCRRGGREHEGCEGGHGRELLEASRRHRAREAAPAEGRKCRVERCGAERAGELHAEPLLVLRLDGDHHQDHRRRPGATDHAHGGGR